MTVSDAVSAVRNQFGCRRECCWNLGDVVTGDNEGIVSGGDVNWLSDGLRGERLPAIDL